MFKAYGFETLTASSGNKALTLLENRIRNLIISDNCMMLIMDGITFCKKVEENLLLKTVPFILKSARLPEQHDLGSVPIDGLLKKLFHFIELIDKFKALLAD